MVFSNPIPFRDLSIIHCNNDDLITIWLCYCWLENIQVFCFSEKKNNNFPGWRGDNFSFEILIVSFYSLFKNATAALKHEKK